MLRTKTALAVAACLAGVAGGSIAAAQADSGATGATGTTGASATPASITVNGAGTISVDASDSVASMQGSYLTALSSALGDAHTKAIALSAAVGDTLGAVENITEQSNDDGLCSGPVFAAGSAKGAPVPAVSPGSKKKKPTSPKPKKASARIADESPSTCTLEADITVTYAMAPA